MTDSIIDKILLEVKSQGLFDEFRKECIFDVDTKPAYQNLKQRVENSVQSFINLQKWSPNLNRNQVREKLRKNIIDAGYLETGVERIVDQVVNPKISTEFHPKIETLVYKYLGIEKPKMVEPTIFEDSKSSLEIKTDDLSNDLDELSPYSDKTDSGEPSGSQQHNQDQFDPGELVEEFESPPFEPLVESDVVEMKLEMPKTEDGGSMDSHMSEISGLTSQDSVESETEKPKDERVTTLTPEIPDKPTEERPEEPNDLGDDSQQHENDSQLSQVSSNSRLSIITDGEISSPRLDITEEAQMPNFNDNSDSVEKEDKNRPTTSNFDLNAGEKYEFKGTERKQILSLDNTSDTKSDLFASGSKTDSEEKNEVDTKPDVLSSQEEAPATASKFEVDQSDDVPKIEPEMKPDIDQVNEEEPDQVFDDPKIEMKNEEISVINETKPIDQPSEEAQDTPKTEPEGEKKSETSDKHERSKSSSKPSSTEKLSRSESDKKRDRERDRDRDRKRSHSDRSRSDRKSDSHHTSSAKDRDDKDRRDRSKSSHEKTSSSSHSSSKHHKSSSTSSSNRDRSSSSSSKYSHKSSKSSSRDKDRERSSKSSSSDKSGKKKDEKISDDHQQAHPKPNSGDSNDGGGGGGEGGFATKPANGGDTASGGGENSSTSTTSGSNSSPNAVTNEETKVADETKNIKEATDTADDDVVFLTPMVPRFEEPIRDPDSIVSLSTPPVVIDVEFFTAQNQLDTATALDNIPPIICPITNQPLIADAEVKIKKPRFASNFSEARKLHKLRKKIGLQELKRKDNLLKQYLSVNPNSELAQQNQGIELEFACQPRDGHVAGPIISSPQNPIAEEMATNQSDSPETSVPGDNNNVKEKNVEEPQQEPIVEQKSEEEPEFLGFPLTNEIYVVNVAAVEFLRKYSVVKPEKQLEVVKIEDTPFKLPAKRIRKPNTSKFSSSCFELENFDELDLPNGFYDQSEPTKAAEVPAKPVVEPEPTESNMEVTKTVPPVVATKRRHSNNRLQQCYSNDDLYKPRLSSKRRRGGEPETTDATVTVAKVEGKS